MEKRYDLIVYIGRFQPPHLGHIQTIRRASGMAQEVLVICGSSNARKSPKNPFSYKEREEMIIDSVDRDNVSVQPSKDYLYDEDLWTSEVQKTILKFYKNVIGGDQKNIAIIGHKKDDSSYYLNNFPNWEFIETGANENVLNATDIRELIFNVGVHYTRSVLCREVYDYIQDWSVTSDYYNLKSEFDYYRSYDPSIYPINMVTADAVVIQSGHVLLIERKNEPGVGCLALPGGFVDTTEKVLDGAIRELREETGLKVPEKVLRGSIYKQEMFDSPTRSERGRVITHVYGFHLDNEEKLPRVRGNSDSRAAFWVPFAEALNRGDEFFEDHYHILYNFI